MTRFLLQLTVLLLLLQFFPAASARAFQLKGYADLDYFLSSSRIDPEEKNGSFALGQLDLFMTHLISDRIDVLSEVVIESDKDDDFVVDLERLQVGYLFSDALKVQAGRFHNIIGYWNITYHHAFLFQTSVDRPSFLDFEDDGGFLPIHLAGLYISGTVPAPSVKIDYGMMLGNGSHIERDDSGEFVLEPEDVKDPNKNKAVSANLIFQPLSRKGFRVGIFGSYGRVPGFDGSFDTPPILKVNQLIFGGFLDYPSFVKGPGHVELLSEYFHIQNKDTLSDQGNFISSAYYLQVGYRLTKRLLPYFRYEYVQVEGGDPYFAQLSIVDSSRWLTGLRFSQNPNSALKAELEVVDEAGRDRYTRYALQWAFGF